MFDLKFARNELSNKLILAFSKLFNFAMKIGKEYKKNVPAKCAWLSRGLPGFVVTKVGILIINLKYFAINYSRTKAREL
jgi:hypothetical protein